jgi:hypothetical protein
MCLQFIKHYRSNWRILRQAVNEFGKACEKWSYEELDRDASEIPATEQILNGAKLEFGIERWDKKENGDLRISVTVGGLPTLLGAKPAYEFAKRRDGSIYYP